MSDAYDQVLRPVGSASCTSRVSTSVRCTCCTSTTGDWPETVTLSSSAPTDRATSMSIAKPAASTSSSRTWVPNPGNVKVTE